MIDAESQVETNKGNQLRSNYYEISTEYGQMWKNYLRNFHTAKAGITEMILQRSFADVKSGKGSINAYDWLSGNLPQSGVIIDLGCGSGPFRRHGAKSTLIGVDVSTEEIRIAASHGGYKLIQSDVSKLPLKSNVADAAISSMALMLFDSLELVFKEMNRILKPNGLAILLLPASKPLSIGDLQHYFRLFKILRISKLDYPNDVAINRLESVALTAGFKVVSDENLKFEYVIRSEGDARTFLESLYLPKVDTENFEKAVELARKWIGKSMGIPLRCVVMSKY